MTALVPIMPMRPIQRGSSNGIIRDSPDTGSTAANVCSLSPSSKSSRHGRVVPGPAGCVSAAANVSTEPSSLLTGALRTDPGVERHAVM
jgi:hypothetical protein